MKVLIVDDEPLAREGLRRQLEGIPGVVLVGECGTRRAAVEAIVERRPDVVLLDIQLGRRTAFEIVEEIGIEAMPLVIFVTAYDRHAVKAFEVHALDYVLKPVDPERLKEALDRAASALAGRPRVTLADRMDGLLVVRDGERLALLDAALVEWLESDGNYVKVHSGGRGYVMRTTMDRMAERLVRGGAFVRVRRSVIVNVRAIATAERYGKGTWVLRLKGGAKVISSRYYQAGLRQLLKSEG